MAKLGPLLRSWYGAFLLALLLPLAALAAALTSQYSFGYQPCVLCVWQRWPYAICALLAAIGLSRHAARWCGPLLLLCIALLAVDAGIAIFHIGVEQHWWLGTSGCAIQDSGATDPAALRRALLATPIARCDEIAWQFLGLSMAAWNALYALAATALVLRAALKGRHG